ncbi:uncharacterized protein LOC119669103 [Teleopsis dalmanni]|uniref:uncharacterized protein LOC119669103 n=1 Tax=Teleopsis dalmanni TaxID=139649 RepID=UPI0018CDFF2F|nr:uncharacterized protein LOC119669103 [Teleopsis dalmanni]
MACGKEYDEDVENLRNLFHTKNIVKFEIKFIKCTPGSCSGDNYMSYVHRLLLSEYEEEYSTGTEMGTNLLSYIVKRQITNKARRQLYRCDEAFDNEINAYTFAVPMLENYAKDVLFPKCFFAGTDKNGQSLIILNDLKALGYRMHNRLVSMNLHYCELVMKQLAKLHAASITAKQMNYEHFSERCNHVQEIVYNSKAEECYRNMIENSIGEALNSLRRSNVDGCLTEPIRIIEKLQTKMYHQIQEYITKPEESIKVLCHGDLWVNNIMFATATPTTPIPVRNQREQKDLPEVIFFDLQVMRYTSPVFDILHFIYTSTKRDLREAYTNTLLETYCLELSTILGTTFRNDATDLKYLRSIFNLRNITEEYYKYVLYGLAIAMWVLPAITFDPNNLPNLDTISQMNTSAKDIKCTQILTHEYHSRVKDLALEFYQNGYLNSYISDI